MMTYMLVQGPQGPMLMPVMTPVVCMNPTTLNFHTTAFVQPQTPIVSPLSTNGIAETHSNVSTPPPVTHTITHTVTHTVTADETQLLTEMQWYMKDHCNNGSTSFVNLQRNMKETVPCLVDKVLGQYDNSWHRFIQRCGTLIVFHYTKEDIARLTLGCWADEHEARVRLASTTLQDCELQDKKQAEFHAVKIQDLLSVCAEEVRSKGTVEVSALSKLLSEKVPYFDGMTKSALKRVLSRSPNSTVWVSGNFVKVRRTAFNASQSNTVSSLENSDSEL